MGVRSRPTYRVVVIDSRKARDGEYIESVGNYDPRTKLLNLNPERVEHWISMGAQPSDTVSRLIRRHSKQHAQPAAEPATAAGELVPAETLAATPEPEVAAPTEPTPEGATQ